MVKDNKKMESMCSERKNPTFSWILGCLIVIGGILAILMIVGNVKAETYL